MVNQSENQDLNCDNDLNDIIGQIDKEFGTGSLMPGLKAGALVHVDVFPTNIAAIDVALGCGGVPQGRILEIFGPESSGKTTTCLQLVAACQTHYFKNKKRYGRVVFIDAEHALDPDWATKIGVNMSKLAISQPGNGEEALKIAEKLTKTGKVDLIVVDSVAALTPKAEIDGEIGDHHVGAQARMMSQAMRKLVSLCAKTKTTIIFINQVREKIGVMFGNNQVTPGGRALKFYSSIRGEISKGSALKDGDTVIGFRPSLKFIKNKVAAPFTRAEYDICVGAKERPICGIDKMSSLIDIGARKDVGIITIKGSWYAYGDMKLGNGMSNASMFLRNNETLANTIREEIYAKVFGNVDGSKLLPDPIDNDIIDSDDSVE